MGSALVFVMISVERFCTPKDNEIARSATTWEDENRKEHLGLRRRRRMAATSSSFRKQRSSKGSTAIALRQFDTSPSIRPLALIYVAETLVELRACAGNRRYQGVSHKASGVRYAMHCARNHRWTFALRGLRERTDLPGPLCLDLGCARRERYCSRRSTQRPEPILVPGSAA